MAGDKPQLSVIMTADAVGGVWTYCVELAAALEPFGVQFYLLTMGGAPSSAQREQLRSLSNVQLFPSDFKLEWMDSPWNDVEQAGEWMLDLERHLRPDVVHLNGYCHGSLDWRAPKLVVAHSCVLSWWQAVKGGPAPEDWNEYATRVKQGLAAADLIAAPSHAMLGELDRIYGPLTGRVIPNGRRIVTSHAMKKEPLILSAGRLWDEAKNLLILQPVSRKVCWPICVAGDSQHPSGARRGFDNEEKSLAFLGKLSPQDLVNWLGRASIYVLPARYEPFGLSVLEAALSGCALVLGDISSLRENWSGAACFVRPNDPEEITHCLNGLIANPESISHWGALARRRASNFTPRKMASAYLSVYQKLVRDYEEREMEAPCVF